MKEQDGLLTVPVKIRFDETCQFSEGSANVFVRRFEGRSENSEVLLRLIHVIPPNPAEAKVGHLSLAIFL